MPRNKPRPEIGDTIAVSNMPDATRFEVIGHAPWPQGLRIRQPRDPGMDRDYAPQYIDRCMVVQHWPKGK